MPTSAVAQAVFCCDMDQHCFSCCHCLDKDTCLQTRSPASEHNYVQHNCVSNTIIVKLQNQTQIDKETSPLSLFKVTI